MHCRAMPSRSPPHALEGNSSDRAGNHPGRLDRGERRVDHHDQPGRQGGFQPPLVDPPVVCYQGLRAGGARPSRDHARHDSNAGGIHLSPAREPAVVVLALAAHDLDHFGRRSRRWKGLWGQAAHMAFPRASQAVANAAGTMVGSWEAYLSSHQEHFWAAVTTLAVILLLLSGGYRRLERITTVLVAAVTLFHRGQRGDPSVDPVPHYLARSGGGG